MGPLPWLVINKTPLPVTMPLLSNVVQRKLCKALKLLLNVQYCSYKARTWKALLATRNLNPGSAVRSGLGVGNGVFFFLESKFRVSLKNKKTGGDMA